MFLDLGGPVWFQTSVVWCVSDLGGFSVFLDLGGPVYSWTSVAKCILDLGGQICFCSI